LIELRMNTQMDDMIGACAALPHDDLALRRQRRLLLRNQISPRTGLDPPTPAGAARVPAIRARASFAAGSGGHRLRQRWPAGSDPNRREVQQRLARVVAIDQRGPLVAEAGTMGKTFALGPLAVRRRMVTATGPRVGSSVTCHAFAPPWACR
jgi:hypothetical protein